MTPEPCPLLLPLLGLVGAAGGDLAAARADRRDLAAEVAALVAPWDREDSPGGAVAVLRGEELLLSRAFGMADLAARRPNEAATPFYLASLAKPFTAACVAHAALAGKLDLDASVRELFPELPEAHGAATLRHLLQHRSGIADVYDAAIVLDLGPEAVRSNAAALELLTHLPRLAFRPGERFLYSNSGYVLLAEALRRRTGQDLAAYARAHLFGPLGMDGARYLGEPGLELAARSYELTEGGWSTRDLPTGLRGPGGLYASLEDLVRWARAWRDERWDGAPLREVLRAAPEGGHDPMLGRYGCGWMLQHQGGLAVERHFGGAFGASSDFLRFPDQDVTVVVLSNAGDLSAHQLAPEIAALVLAGELEPEEPPAAAPLTPAERARLGRIWREAATGDVWILTDRGERFVLATLGDFKVRLVPVSATLLVGEATLLPLAVALDGERLVVECDGRRATLERLPFPPADVPPLAEYSGTYASAALGAEIRLEARGNGLVLDQRRPLLVLTPFLPLGRDLFVSDRGARIDFRRDQDGRIAGLTIHGNRAFGLELERLGR